MKNYIKSGLILTGQTFQREFTAIIKDPGALLILFLALIIYPIIYGIAYKNEVLRDLKVAVVDLDRTATSRTLSRMIDATADLHVASRPASMAEAEALFYSGEVHGVFLIPKGLEKAMMKGGQSVLSVYCDAGYFLMYKQTLSAAMKSSGTFGAGVEIKRYMARGKTVDEAMAMRDPVSIKTVTLYNPQGGYNTFVLPGLLIVLLQQTLLIGIGLLGGTEREAGRARFAIPRSLTRGGVVPIVCGKAFAYLLVYIVNLIITQVWVYHWYKLPNLGGFFPAIALALPFLVAVIFLGIALSTFFEKREHSILFVVFLSPVIMFLTGLSWPVSAIPGWLDTIGRIFPTRTMVTAWIRVRTMGADFQHIKADIAELLLQALVYFILAIVLYYLAARRLEKSGDTDSE